MQVARLRIRWRFVFLLKNEGVGLADKFLKYGQLVSHEVRSRLPVTVVRLESLLHTDRVVGRALLARVCEHVGTDRAVSKGCRWFCFLLVC